MPDESTFDFAAFRSRLHSAAHSAMKQSKSAKTQDAKEDVVEITIKAIEKRVGVTSRHIVTVRERSGFREERLRHVYASHPEIRDWFNRSDQEWFDNRNEKQSDKAAGMESSAFKDPRATYISPVRFDGPTCHCAVFHIAKRQVLRTKRTGSKKIDNEIHIFPDRIDLFLKETAALEFEEPISFDEINGCLVFGLTKTVRSRPINQMLAVYVGGLQDDKVLPKGNKLADRLGDCAQIVAEMFRTINEIQVRERLELERRALKDFVGLVPTFADDDVSPSDAVAALLRKFSAIFDGHVHFGPGCYQLTDDAKQHEWVTFLSVNYRTNEDEEFMPVLSVYPQFKVRENQLQSYRVSRTDTLSISKYLLHKFLESEEIATPVEFREKFKDIKCVPEKAFYPKEGTPVGLALTMRDDAWGELQFDIFGQHTRTTAAFLLRRSTGDDKKPFAILVFESDHPDAFSAADIELLSRLVDASASLHSDIKIGSHSTDFSAQCKEAFTDRVPGTIGGIEYWKLAFELTRFDHHAARAILSCNEEDAEKLWKHPHKLADEDARKAVLEVVTLIDTLKSEDVNSPDDKGRFDRWLWSNTETRDWLRDKWGTNTSDIHQFLADVPPNDVWYCYLGSIGRALASRDFDTTEGPEFKRFPTGYSALAMFVVDEAFAERQIAKLTTFKKLKTEQENYKKHVRYRIPLAARIAEKGVAFDTLGRGKEYREEDGFGVIISDLIAGTSRREQIGGMPLSFLTRCDDVINYVELLDEPLITDVVDQIVYAIRFHFRENVSSWIEAGGNDWKDRDITKRNKLKPSMVPGHIERWTRTGGDESRNIANVDGRLRDSTTRIDKVAALSNATREFLIATEAYCHRTVQIRQPRNFGTETTLQALVEVLNKKRERNGPLPSMTENAHHFKGSYFHGDLNGNNLTWAANYDLFVMIDFETVDLGVVGLDQLKLFASMICETIPTARRRPGKKVNSVAKAQHQTMVGLIRLVPWLISEVVEAGDKPRCKANLDKQAKLITDRKEYVSLIAIEILRTIGFDKLDLQQEDAQRFWKWIVRNLFFRQFEYAYRSLDESHVDALVVVTKAIGGLENTDEATENEVPNVLDGVREDNVIMLFYAFMALLATLEHEE